MFWPIHPNKKQLDTKTQNNFLKKGLKKDDLTSLVFRKGKKARQTIDPNIAITPPSLCGIDRKIA